MIEIGDTDLKKIVKAAAYVDSKVWPDAKSKFTAGLMASMLPFIVETCEEQGCSVSDLSFEALADRLHALTTSPPA